MESYRHHTRIYAQGATLAQGAILDIDGQQHHHLVNVLRKREGDEIVLFNGVDGQFLARIESVGKRAVRIVVTQHISNKHDVSLRLHLFMSIVKPAKMELVAQKATELGVSFIRPVIASRCNIRSVKEDKLRTYMRDAAEQCWRDDVPELLSVVTIEEALMQIDMPLLYCNEMGRQGSDIYKICSDLRTQGGEEYGLLIGPEGGLAEQELEMLAAHDRAIGVTLGPLILRAETAAIAALSCVQSLMGSWTAIPRGGILREGGGNF